jgi:hypothetical protein
LYGVKLVAQDVAEFVVWDAHVSVL